MLFLQTDLTLGGALKYGRFAQITRAQLYQTQDADDTGESGAQRLARISGELAIASSYIPT